MGGKGTVCKKDKIAPVLVTDALYDVIKRVTFCKLTNPLSA